MFSFNRLMLLTKTEQFAIFQLSVLELIILHNKFYLQVSRASSQSASSFIFLRPVELLVATVYLYHRLFKTTEPSSLWSSDIWFAPADPLELLGN